MAGDCVGVVFSAGIMLIKATCAYRDRVRRVISLVFDD